MLWAVLTAVAVYLLLSAVYGDRGEPAIRNIEVFRDRLEQNVDDLRARNRVLETRVQLLRVDASAVMVEAQKLGLTLPGQELVRIEPEPGIRGLGRNWRPGGVLTRPEQKAFVNKNALRGIAGASGLVCYVVLFLLSLRQRRGVTARRIAEEDIPKAS